MLGKLLIIEGLLEKKIIKTLKLSTIEMDEGKKVKFGTQAR